MIAKLTGKIDEVFAGYLILDVAGVGYKVESIEQGLLAGSEQTFYIYTHVREQELRLFGFSSRSQLLFFESILQISGVGPRVAMSLLRNLPLDQVLAAILGNDFKALKSPGVGEKIAKRIVIEMTSKIEKLGLDIDAAPAGIIHNPVDELEQELVAAMESLGYARKDIIALIAKTDFSAEADIQTKIRKLLSLLR